MPTNHIRDRLTAGEVAFGARTVTFRQEIVAAYGRLGLSFVWLDLEHSGPSPYDAQALGPLVQAARETDIELLVRVPTADPAMIHKLLATGVRTVLIPRVKTVEEVRRAVRASRFTYEGEPGNRGYGGPPPGWDAGTEFIDVADSTTVVGVMIEHEQAVNTIEDILAVPGLGFVFIGANDLSVSMGYPGKPDHRAVQDAIKTVEDAARHAGVPYGAPKHHTQAAREAIESGYRILRISDERDAIQTAIGDQLTSLGDAAAE